MTIETPPLPPIDDPPVLAKPITWHDGQAGRVFREEGERERWYATTLWCDLDNWL